MILAAVNTAGDAVLIAILGWLVVILGLAALVFVIAAVGIIIKKKMDAKKDQPSVIVEEEPEASEDAPVAPGSAGQLKMHDVEPKTAAMLMAIVADKMGKPLNELRFISIKEVK